MGRDTKTNMNMKSVAALILLSIASVESAGTDCKYGTKSTCATRVDQGTFVNGLSLGAYKGDLKSVYQCAYARTFKTGFCVPTKGKTKYASAIAITSSAGSNGTDVAVSFTLDIEVSFLNAQQV